MYYNRIYGTPTPTSNEIVIASHIECESSGQTEPGPWLSTFPAVPIDIQEEPI